MMTMPPLLSSHIHIPDAPVAGMRVWYDANQEAYANNDPVDTFTDRSGNGHHMTQAGAARPTFKTNIANGKPALLFDGVDDFMATTDLWFPTGYQHTIFLVLPLLPDPGGISSGTIFDTNNLGALSRRYGFANKPGGQTKVGFERDGGGGTQSLDFTAGEHVLYMVRTDGASSLMRLNGDASRQATFVVSSDTTAALGSATLGTLANAVGAWFSGYIAEMLIYPSALSDPNTEANEDLLKAKYTIV